MEMLYFIRAHKYFIAFILFVNILLANLISKKIHVHINRHIYEALGGRDERASLYRRCISVVRNMVDKYERRGKKHGFYIRMKDKMRKSGYEREKAAAVYIILRFLLIPMFFLISVIISYPNVIRAITGTALIYMVIELVILANRKKHNLVFQKHVYKIYKYLHNQVSSGIRVADAIKTAYEVVEDRKLRKIFIKMAASYELTLDIDIALQEFKSNYDIQEADTLSVALKQGIITGDNRELLARQEDIMFKKHFNYIQVETDNCKFRSAAAVALFCIIIVTLIAIPIIKDVIDAVDKIFIG